MIQPVSTKEPLRRKDTIKDGSKFYKYDAQWRAGLLVIFVTVWGSPHLKRPPSLYLTRILELALSNNNTVLFRQRFWEEGRWVSNKKGHKLKS